MKNRDILKQAGANIGLTLARIARGLQEADKTKDKITKMEIEDKAYKRHFPRRGIIESYLKKTAADEAAVVRGRAAVSFLGSLLEM